MIQRLSILCLVISLSSCSYFTSYNNKHPDDQIARCVQLKHDIVFNQATDDALVAAHKIGELDTLTRDFRQNECT